MDDLHDWFDNVEQAEKEESEKVSLEESQQENNDPVPIKTASDFARAKLGIKTKGNKSAEFNKGYKAGYVAAIEEQREKWYTEGYRAGRLDTRPLDD